jgi:hypothetical protein
MSARKKSAKSERKPPKRNTDAVGAYSIADFCRQHGGMSEAFFHKLISDGDGPRLMRVGGRTMVSVEAAAAWRRAHEAETLTKRQREQATVNANAQASAQ